MRRAAALPVCLAAGAAVLVALTRTRLGDYSEVRVGADNAAPAIRAILGGDLDAAVHLQPVMGLVSLLLRVPLAALGGHDVLWTYRLGSLACLLAAALLAVALDRRLVARSAGLGTRLVTGAVVIANPMTFLALNAGHPEEVLAAALVCGAVLTAVEGHALRSAVLLGLAVGTKQWALLAVGPCLLALPAGRRRLLVVAGALAAVAILPPALADTGRYRHAAREITSVHRVYPETAWWPVSPERTIVVHFGGGESRTAQVRRLPLGLDRGATTYLIVAAAAALTLLLWRRRAEADPLALLVAVLLLRVIADPVNLGYYSVPWLLALATWATVRGAPVLVPVGATAVAALSFDALTGRASDAVHCAVFLAWAIPLLVAALAVSGRPAQAARLRERSRYAR